MIEPTLNYVHCPDASGGHRMAYWEWGNPQSAHVVVCVHGLSRQGRDFDVLARALCDKAGNDLRVVCPDVVGRGQSDWLKDPAGYQVPNYAADMLALLAQLQPTTLDWVGTSMGGLIGLVVCGQADLPLPVPVRRLVLNDVGPSIQWDALQRIGEYLGRAVQFDSVQQAADALWAISTSFGPHTPAQWLAFSRPMVKAVAGVPGRWTLHYDPAIAVPFRAMTPEMAAQSEALLWQLYDNIKATTLLLRGAQSDLLSLETAQAMTVRGPKARLVEFAGVGHAPTFIVDGQVQTVTSFLLD
ncbi:MAG: alpha/beta hydrolase [Rhodoferax sp.]|uniref:alpha/beta fold hydrolase n=1 Tax=Rhodoferax sp. TaxID=50421 RepID=UPI00179A33BD|nr:alpha/beta hydrolase [Rhodoferax sp.]NMM12630.1 alpha/beta hydrolase [Rhodoferax sp.]